MKKLKKLILLLIFIFFILPIIMIGVVVADVYLTVSNFDPNQVKIDIASPTASLSADNKTLSFSTSINATIPQAGFIPKAVTFTFQLMQNTTELGTPSTFTIDLGKTVVNTINQSIDLSQELTDSLTLGNSIEITIKSSATISIFDFAIPYSFNYPDQTFNIP